MGQHEAAREATKRAINLNPTLARAQANLALERYGGERETTQPSARPQIVEGGALAHCNLGLAFRQKGYHEEAMREYHLALEAAELHILRRDLAAALALYEELVRDYPDSPKVWNERGVCLHQAGRRVDAVASYEQAVAMYRRGDYAGIGFEFHTTDLFIGGKGRSRQCLVGFFGRLAISKRVGQHGNDTSRGQTACCSPVGYTGLDDPTSR